jgi:hypothetical protein
VLHSDNNFDGVQASAERLSGKAGALKTRNFTREVNMPIESAVLTNSAQAPRQHKQKGRSDGRYGLDPR